MTTRRGHGTSWFYSPGMAQARRQDAASAAAELAVMADTIERHRERVAALVTPFLGTEQEDGDLVVVSGRHKVLGTEREDVVTSIHEAERQLMIAARALRRAIKSLER